MRKVELSGEELSGDFWTTHFLRERALPPLATAYLRSRQADRISSYGDFAALSDVVDLATAEVLTSVASDGVIAPGYASDALSVLRKKKNGRYLVLAIDPDFEPRGPEVRTEFGLTLIQDIDTSRVPDPRAARIVSRRTEMTDSERDSLLLAMVVAKHTPSNAVVITMKGQAIGIGAGQQSRIAATQLACAKADAYRLLDHPKVSSLAFAASVGRIEKMNLVEMFLRWCRAEQD